VDPVEGGVLGALERLTEKVARLNAQLGGETELRLDVAPSLDDLRAELEYFRTVLSRLDASAVDVDLTDESDARTLLRVERRDITRHVGYLEDLIARREQAVLPTPAADETPAPLEAAQPEPEPEPPPEPEAAPEPIMAPLELPWLTTEHERRFRPASIAAGIAVALVVIVLGAVLLWPDSGPSPTTARVTRAPQTNGVVLDPPRELTVAPQGPSACTVLTAATVDRVVGQTLTAAPAAGRVCSYTNAAPVTIDPATAYPPFVTQVNVDYRAPVTRAQFEATRSATGTTDDLSANGLAAYAPPGGASATVFANDVAVTVELIAQARAESIPQLRGWAIQLAIALRSQLPV
jgi:hypothetical protein